MFIDSDDWLELSACEQLYNAINKKNVDILFFNWFIVTNKKKYPLSWTQNFDSDEIFYFNDAPEEFFNLSTSMNCGIFQKSILTKNFDTNIEKTEDALYLWELLLKNLKISVLNEPLYNYYQRNNSTMHNISVIKKCHLFKSIEKLLNNNDYKKADNYIKAHILNRFIKSLLFEINFFNKHKEQKIPKYYYKKSKELIKLIKKYDKNSTHQFEEPYILEKNLSQLKYQKIAKLCKKLFWIKETNERLIINICGIKIKCLKEQFKKEKKYINKIKNNRKKYPKTTYLFFDCLEDPKAECIDAYSLYTHMKSQGGYAYYAVLKDTNLYKKLIQEDNLDNIIALDNSIKTHPGDFFEAIYPILNETKAIVTSFGVFSKESQKFITNNKYWQYIFIQHGVVFLKETVMINGYLKPNKFDKILISSEYEYKIFKKYGWTDDKLIKCGLPRWDLLNKSQQKERSILVMLTWRRFKLLEFENSLYKKNLIKFLNNNNLHKYLKENNIKLYFAPHHSLLGLCGLDFNLDIENVEFVDSNECSKYIQKCSCLITDWSSVAFDFMFQNKPVICYILDKNDPVLGKWDNLDIKHFDYKQYIMPNVFFDEESVIKKLKFYIENNFQLEPKTQEKYDNFFYTKENIREKLSEEIEKICSDK